MPLLVNNEPVAEAEIREEARLIRPRLREAMVGEDPAVLEARVRQWARENVIERVVLRQAALADPDPILPGAPALLGPDDEIQRRVARLLARATAHLSRPRNKDVTEYYRKNRASLHAPERVHAGHIIKNVDESTDEATALAAIQDIHNQLQNGAAFEELAEKHSDCPGNGGDLGTFPRGQMVSEFDAVVFALEPGQVSGIFRTSFGFHIAKVYDRKPEGVPELQEVRLEIEELLFEKKKQRAIEQFLDRLIAKADIRET